MIAIDLHRQTEKWNGRDNLCWWRGCREIQKYQYDSRIFPVSCPWAGLPEEKLGESYTPSKAEEVEKSFDTIISEEILPASIWIENPKDRNELEMLWPKEIP